MEMSDPAIVCIVDDSCCGEIKEWCQDIHVRCRVLRNRNATKKIQLQHAFDERMDEIRQMDRVLGHARVSVMSLTAPNVLHAKDAEETNEDTDECNQPCSHRLHYVNEVLRTALYYIELREQDITTSIKHEAFFVDTLQADVHGCKYSMRVLHNKIYTRRHTCLFDAWGELNKVVQSVSRLDMELVQAMEEEQWQHRTCLELLQQKSYAIQSIVGYACSLGCDLACCVSMANI